MVNQQSQANAALISNEHCSLFSQMTKINYNNFPLSTTNKHQIEWRISQQIANFTWLHPAPAPEPKGKKKKKKKKPASASRDQWLVISNRLLQTMDYKSHGYTTNGSDGDVSVANTVRPRYNAIWIMRIWFNAPWKILDLKKMTWITSLFRLNDVQSQNSLLNFCEGKKK